MSTIIRYFVPEDRDLEEKPNAFIIYKDTDKVRLRDIKENFPLPGQYIYRFKTDYQKSKVWIHLEDEEGAIPLNEGKIIIKINRLSWEDNNSNSNNNKNNNNNNQFTSDFPDFS